MSRNHDGYIKFFGDAYWSAVQTNSCITQLEGGFTGNTIGNPKNESCKAVETGFEVATNKGKEEIVEEVFIEEEEVRIEKEKSNNQGDQEERGVTIEQLLDKNSPWIRAKNKILNQPNPELPNYIKPPYPIIKKKHLKEDEA